MKKKNEFSEYPDEELPILMTRMPDPDAQKAVMAEITRRASSTNNRLAIFSLVIAAISLIVAIVGLFYK